MCTRMYIAPSENDVLFSKTSKFYYILFTSPNQSHFCGIGSLAARVRRQRKATPVGMVEVAPWSRLPFLAESLVNVKWCGMMAWCVKNLSTQFKCFLFILFASWQSGKVSTVVTKSWLQGLQVTSSCNVSNVCLTFLHLGTIWHRHWHWRPGRGKMPCPAGQSVSISVLFDSFSCRRVEVPFLFACNNFA